MEGISNAEAAEHKIGGPKHIDTIRQKQNEEDGNGIKKEKNNDKKEPTAMPTAIVSPTEKKDIEITVDSGDSDNEQNQPLQPQPLQPQPLQPQPLQPQPPQHCQPQVIQRQEQTCQPQLMQRQEQRSPCQPQLMQRQEDRFPPPPSTVDMSDVERRLTPPSSLVAMVAPAPLLPMHHNGCVVASPESARDHEASNDIDCMDVQRNNTPVPLCTSLSPQSCENNLSLIESAASDEVLTPNHAADDDTI